jgi:hypothetical protein
LHLRVEKFGEGVVWRQCCLIPFAQFYRFAIVAGLGIGSSRFGDDLSESGIARLGSVWKTAWMEAKTNRGDMFLCTQESQHISAIQRAWTT